MSEVHCHAPWVGGSHMPNGKFAPCCAWGGPSFNSREEMTQEVGGAFLRGEIPKYCETPCPPEKNGWRDGYNIFDTDYNSYKIKFLDFRNNNICNMKCRSCGPGFSSLWASEAGYKEVHFYKPIKVDGLDLSECEKVYFAGGEPLLNPQHYEVLEKLAEHGNHPEVMYSTNLSVLGYKDRHVKDYWPKFNKILLHPSIDAVGRYAEVVRSGTIWENIERNLAWAREQPNVHIRIATVVSAINIWFLPSLFEFLEWVTEPHSFEPILANVDSVIGLTSIPMNLRQNLITMLSESQFKDKHNILRAIETLKENNYNEANWHLFLAQQMLLDKVRGENWYELLPTEAQNNIYKEVLRVG